MPERTWAPAELGLYIPKIHSDALCGQLFFFAGVWWEWEGRRGTMAAPAEGKHLIFSFLTTAADATVAPIHAKGHSYAGNESIYLLRHS